jgi:hypothetical protein
MAELRVLYYEHAGAIEPLGKVKAAKEARLAKRAAAKDSEAPR